MSKVRELPDGPMDETGLTQRQRMVLEVIRDSVQRRGYPPSMREIGEAVGLTSTSSVSHQLRSLQRKGFLRRDPNRPRAVEVRVPGTTPVRTDEEAFEAAGASPRPRSPRPPTCRSSAGSPPVARSSPRRPSRTCSRCRSSSSARAPTSC